MNKSETEMEFKKDVKTKDYEILYTEKLHLNVSRISVRINNQLFIFGYSYNTIIMVNVDNINIVTDEDYSVSTSKHKSQVQRNLNHSQSLYISEQLFDYILEEILSGNEITTQKIKEFIKESGFFTVIKTISQELSGNEPTGFIRFLLTHKILYNGDEKELIKEIKEIIWFKLHLNKNIELTIKDKKIAILKKDEKYIFNDKEYKNLSFLNKIELKEIKKIRWSDV